MNDKLFKFKDVEPNKVETEAVSLVISDVPSKVAYDILMTALVTGEDLSPGAIQEKVEKRINGPVAQVTFSEFLQSLNISTHSFDENGVCKDCGYRFAGPSVPFGSERVEVALESPAPEEQEHRYAETKVEKVAEDSSHVGHPDWLEKMFGEDTIREDPPTNSGKEMEDEGRSL